MFKSMPSRRAANVAFCAGFSDAIAVMGMTHAVGRRPSSAEAGNRGIGGCCYGDLGGVEKVAVSA